MVPSGGILKPHVKHLLELDAGDDVSAREVHAHLTQADHVVLVGEDQHRQSVFCIQHQVVSVEVAQEIAKDAHTGDVFM